MDDAHKNHILKNWDKLIELTSCSVMVMAKLQTNGILTEDECKSLMKVSNDLEQNLKLYQLLLTRKRSYAVMKQILYEEKQDTYFDILAKDDPTLCSVIIYDKSGFIGRGGQNTIVYSGRFGKIPVAVKAINCHNIDKRAAMEEIEMYTKLSIDVDENIRYYTAIEENSFILIALELCECNLAVCIKEKKFFISIPDVLLQTTKGLKFLHGNGILHLDLKPENVLLKMNSNNRVVVKISDFGIARQIVDADNSAMTLNISSGVGTYGWMAPEIQTFVSGGQRKISATRAADIFSLGCVFYFSISNGNHAFGDEIHCRANIADNKPQIDLSQFESQYNDYYWLISTMINHKSVDRPFTTRILSHPAFWSPYKILKFISDIEFLLRYNIGNSQINFQRYKESFTKIFKDERQIFTNEWLHRLSDVVINYVISNNIINSEEDVLQQIITTISRLFNDYGRVPQNVKESLGKTPEEFLLYWTTKFPLIVWMLWAHFENMKHETKVSSYYMEYHPSFSALIGLAEVSLAEHGNPRYSEPELVKEFGSQAESTSFFTAQSDSSAPDEVTSETNNSSDNGGLRGGRGFKACKFVYL